MSNRTSIANARTCESFDRDFLRRLAENSEESEPIASFFRQKHAQSERSMNRFGPISHHVSTKAQVILRTASATG